MMELNMASTLLITLVSSLLFLLMLLKWVTVASKSANLNYLHFPGPKTLPLIGNLNLMLGAAAPHHLFRDLAAKYGPMMHLQMGEIHLLVVSSADLAREVLKTHDVNFANRPPAMVPGVLAYNHTDVVFAPYGEYWRQLKKICTLEILSVRRMQTFRPIREEENMNMAKWIASRQGSSTNLSKRFYKTSYDVVTRAAIRTKTEQHETMISIIQEAAKLASGFVIADLYPSIKSLLALITGLRFRVGRMHRKLDALLDSIIQQHKAAARIGDDDAKVEDLVDVLLRIQQDGTQLPLTTDNIKAVLVDMFIAGTDTSATVVEWAMSEMIRKPSILIKAQEEARKVFDDKGYVDEEKFDELKYMKLIIKETLRLHPPAPLLIPKVNTEACEIKGYKIPAKSRVIVNAWALGRDPKYWKEAEKFIPERFEEESTEIDFKGNDLEYIPFGSGRRMCPGMAFGLANVHFPLAMLLYHFDWQMPHGIKNEELDMTEEFGSTIARKHHLHLIPIVRRPLRAAAA